MTLKWRPTEGGTVLDVDAPGAFMGRLADGMRWEDGVRFTRDDFGFLSGLAAGVADPKERAAIKTIMTAVESCGDVTIDVCY
jgi:hypothetical protein